MTLSEFKSRLKYEAGLARLSVAERIFLTFEEPASSRTSRHVTLLVRSGRNFSSGNFNSTGNFREEVRETVPSREVWEKVRDEVREDVRGGEGWEGVVFSLLYDA